MKETNRIFFVVNVDWFFLSHRLPLALQAIEKGFKVYLLAANTGKKVEIEQYGIHFIEVPFERSGKNIFHELRCITILIKLYRKYKPKIIHHVTLKAAILGSIATKCTKIKNVVNAISGLGYNFTDNRAGALQNILKKSLIYAFRSKDFYFIVQNPDDQKMIQSLKITMYKNIQIIKGSGVNLNEYSYSIPLEKGYIEFLFPARILLDKGIMEFIQAAKILKKELFGKAKFIIAGDCDTYNLAALSENDLKELLDYDYIEWIGFKKNMINVYKNSDVVVLPSYREGLPKSLIEACATGRPIITTDAPGCRECVVNGYNGYLIQIKNIQQLSNAMLYLFNHPYKRILMGENSRKLAEKEFSIDSVIEKTFSIYNELLNRDNL